MELILQPGDPCLECQQQGLVKHLRYFYINLHEQILKCESDACLYPYTDDELEDNVKEISADGEERASSEYTELKNFNSALVLEEFLSSDASISTDFDFVDLMPQIDETLTVKSTIAETCIEECKPKIEIQSVTTIKPEFVKIEPKVERTTLHAVTKQRSKIGGVNVGAVEDDDDIPKARITRCFNALKCIKQEQQKIAPKKRKKAVPKLSTKHLHHQLIKKEPTTESTPVARTSNTSALAEVLQLLNRTTKS